MVPNLRKNSFKLRGLTLMSFFKISKYQNLRCDIIGVTYDVFFNLFPMVISEVSI